METLSRWLEKKGVEAEEKALDYLNKKGLFGKNKKLRAIDQIREIEKEYARDLFFKNCERKLKNNIRQNFSKNKNPDSKPCTFKLSNNSRQLLEKIRNHYGITASQALEMLICNEDAKLLGVTNQLAPHVNNLQNHGMPMNYNHGHSVAWGNTTTSQHDVWNDGHAQQTFENLKKLTENINNASLHNRPDDHAKSGTLQNTETSPQGKRNY
ncbi:hypothetical protein ACR80S_14635 [Halomonas sp. MA07-2]|uniref:hypothetical protein n=1 Tax=Halomonas sp. MA07-2 TaxID=3440841 RepID=UPI003EE90EB7